MAAICLVDAESFSRPWCVLYRSSEELQDQAWGWGVTKAEL